MCMQTDLDMLSEDTIKSIVRNNPLSEHQAQNLIMKEQTGRARKRVIEFLQVQARKAGVRQNLAQAHVVGINLPTVLFVIFACYRNMFVRSRWCCFKF